MAGFKSCHRRDPEDTVQGQKARSLQTRRAEHMRVVLLPTTRACMPGQLGQWCDMVRYGVM
jgi:hypothetical protein